MTWDHDQRREDVIAKFARWRDGENCPEVDGVGQKVSSVELRIASDGGRIVNQWTVRPEMDPVEIADMIINEADSHGKNYNLGGIRPTYVAHVRFGRNKHHSCEISISPQSPNLTDGGGGGSPVFSSSLDLRDPRNQEAAVLGQSIQMTNHHASLMLGGFGSIMTTMEKLLNRQMDQNEVMMRSMNEMRAREQEVMNQQLDRDMRRANEEVKIKLKNAVGEQAIAAIPGLMGAIHQKLGAKLGIDPADIPKEMMEIAEMIFEKPAMVQAIMEGLTEEKQQKLLYLIQMLQKKKENDARISQYQATMGGVSRPMPLAKFKVVVGGVATKEKG